MDKSKNNVAWKKIFKKHKVLERIQRSGCFVITAEQIKKFREPRLMTKFDSKQALPKLFSDNQLAILPTKRGEYIIGKFKNYQDLHVDNSIDVETRYLPDYVTTIDYKKITSEAVSLSSAFISGMIEDLIGEEVIPTVQGRMGTGKFDYKIKTTINVDFNVEVENSQMEIDGSYEGETKFVLVEAKNGYMEDFIVRQLYYPYRVWSKLTSKEIIPVMLIKHDNIFNFYIYKFDSQNDYNSIKLQKIKRYILGEIYRQIELDDILKIKKFTSFVEESAGIPFPQADSFFRVLDVVNALNNTQMKTEEIAELYDFDIRQGNYYGAAARYLGFVKNDKDRFFLTDEGKALVELDHKTKNLEIVKRIISHKPFYLALEQYLDTGQFDNDAIAKSILEVSPKVNRNSTASRRAQTVSSWIRWIINLTTSYESNPFDK